MCTAHHKTLIKIKNPFGPSMSIQPLNTGRIVFSDTPSYIFLSSLCVVANVFFSNEALDIEWVQTPLGCLGCLSRGTDNGHLNIKPKNTLEVALQYTQNLYKNKLEVAPAIHSKSIQKQIGSSTAEE